ncbi:hypothetical protein HSX10_17645 [Winogradskyella undariae]|uniref:hypothetical protein n=1 Tax=Winogradskyella undariae TaxID=1285465 RepID=UPI00156AECB2|nr:hypothetical protein [Winogradskyella undariae]NRR93402.1 hypothetical protein [Winogradskyella undariae]
MNKYLSIIKSNLIGILIAGGIFYWGFANNGYIRMGIALLILLAIIKSGIGNFNYAIELDNWTESNQEKLILFYPTKKTIQEKIKAEFIPKIPYEVMEVYYDGPKLIGDIKRSIVLEIMKWNTNIKIHQPAILKIVNKSVVMEELYELKSIDKEVIDFQKLLNRIDKVKKST